MKRQGKKHSGNFSDCYCLQGKLRMKVPMLWNQMEKRIASVLSFAKVFLHEIGITTIYE